MSTSTGSITTGAWHHVALTYNGDVIRFYIDGQFSGETDADDGTIDAYDAAPLSIGANKDANANWFSGSIDEVRIWNDVRTVDEIRANMYRELSGAESNLVAYYKFNEIDPVTPGYAADSSGNGNNGTYRGGMTDADSVTSGAFAGPRNCLDFDGTDDYVACAGAASGITGTITVEAWVKTPSDWDGTAVYPQIVARGSSNIDGFNLYIYEAGGASRKFSFILLRNGGNWGSDWVLSDVPVETGTWYHLAGVRDDTNKLKLYVNGVMSQGTGGSGAIDYGGSAATYIGIKPAGSEYFKGRIDEVRIWNRARTATEIRDNMCKTLTGNEDGLAAYYRFDQKNAADQATVYDQTAGGTNGTLTNMDPATDWVASTAFTTWIGSEGTNWATGGNWSRNAVPAATDNVGIAGYTGGNAPSAGTRIHARTLVIASDAELVVTGGNQVNVAGHWISSGVFTADNSTVFLNGHDQQIFGNTHFYNLTKETTVADTLTFEKSSVQTIENNLTLTGARDNHLSLKSSEEGTQWEIALEQEGTQELNWLDVQDSDASAGQTPAPYNSVDSGNNINWKFKSPEFVSMDPVILEVGETTGPDMEDGTKLCGPGGDGTYTWTSSNEEVAAVSTDGTVGDENTLIFRYNLSDSGNDITNYGRMGDAWFEPATKAICIAYEADPFDVGVSADFMIEPGDSEEATVTIAFDALQGTRMVALTRADVDSMTGCSASFIRAEIQEGLTDDTGVAVLPGDIDDSAGPLRIRITRTDESADVTGYRLTGALYTIDLVDDSGNIADRSLVNRVFLTFEFDPTKWVPYTDHIFYRETGGTWTVFPDENILNVDYLNNTVTIVSDHISGWVPAARDAGGNDESGGPVSDGGGCFINSANAGTAPVVPLLAMSACVIGFLCSRKKSCFS